MEPTTDVKTHHPQSHLPPTRWQENHGSLLIAFVGMIFLVGACILLYRQNRFVPPQFPESAMITVPDSTEEDESGQVPAASATLSVTGAANDFGSMKLAIYDSESNFNQPDKALVIANVAIYDGKADLTIALDSLPKKIAIAAFHDENDDGILNRNTLGIPTERYGFSQDARGATKPPSFEASAIKCPADGDTVALFIR